MDSSIDKGVAVQRHELLPDGRVLVVLDLECTVVGALAFHHGELDKRIQQLPHVTGCEQHGWIYSEDDETAPVDIFLAIPPGFGGWLWRLPINRGRVARHVRDAVAVIIDELLNANGG